MESIVDYAQKLVGKSLVEVADIPAGIENSKNRGDLGSLVEKYFFEHTPGPVHGPDFALAGLELKTTGVLPAGNGRFRAKERLVLTTINFEEIAGEEWETSTFYLKCRQMLILFYLYQKDVPVTERRFVLQPYLFRLDDLDLEQIKRDWFTIRDKVRRGLAHEITEKDTNYLAACVKGQGGVKDLRSQPFSTKLAKQRAFSFKASYVTNAIINPNPQWESIATENGLTLEEATRKKFAPYLGLEIEEIGLRLESRINYKSKSFRRHLICRILTKDGSRVSELEKAGITLKTVRISHSGKVKESMSFPAFDFDDFDVQRWEDSALFQIVETKFLFAVFKEIDNGGTEILEKVFYWTMPQHDIDEVMRVWHKTRDVYLSGGTVFPKISESAVAHVRPHGQNSRDIQVTKGGAALGKSSFWLNARYIASIVHTKVSST